MERDVAAAERDLECPDLTAYSTASDTTALRGRLALVASELADTEEKVADFHDKLAAERPDGAAGYRQIAQRARVEAEVAREVARRYGG